jgi:hypothetical protein
MWNLDNSANWTLALSQTYYAQPITPDFENYIPIPTISLSVNSYVLLIGCRNPQAKPNWYRAGYASSRLLFTPNNTSSFATATVQSYSGRRLNLNRLNLIKFKDFDLLPYILDINIKQWHKEMFVEVWTYSGETDDIEAQLDRIEEDINTTYGQ